MIAAVTVLPAMILAQIVPGIVGTYRVGGIPLNRPVWILAVAGVGLIPAMNTPHPTLWLSLLALVYSWCLLALGLVREQQVIGWGILQSVILATTVIWLGKLIIDGRHLPALFVLLFMAAHGIGTLIKFPICQIAKLPEVPLFGLACSYQGNLLRTYGLELVTLTAWIILSIFALLAHFYEHDN